MSLLKAATSGMVWTTISTIVRSLVGIFQVSILTRYLEIEDFGTIAIASVFIGFTQIFLDLGISAGIMHRQDATKDELSSLFWLNIFSGLILTIILVACSPLVSLMYDDGSLTPIIMILSLSVLVASLGSQHRTIQQKELRFKSMAIIDIISSILTMAVAILLAINDFGVYSLVYSTLTGAFISNILFLWIGLRNDRNICFYFNLKDTYPYLKIGVFSIGARVLDYFSREIDTVFIGASFGRDVLGVYTLCKKVVQMLYGVINPIITKILTPLFSKLQSDKDKVKHIYLNLIETLAITNFPIYFLVSIFSKSILYILYGEQYIQGGFILSFLAIYYGILSISNPVGSLQISLGRTDIGFYWTIYRLFATFIVIYVSSFFNIEILVILFLLFGLINTILMWRFQLYVMIGMGLSEFISSFIKPFAAMVTISAPFYYIYWSKVSLPHSIFASIIVLLIYSLLIYHMLNRSYVVGLITRWRFVR